MFSGITSIVKPIELSADWSFQMGELRFMIHDGIVELKDEIKDFDSFCQSVDYLNALVDNIESNRMLLSEKVFNFVNVNNELVAALGIDLPYSFATEADEKEAGTAVANAANNDDGFFAKAWESIKQFFIKIIAAIKNVWSNDKLVDQKLTKMNAETSQVIDPQSEEQIGGELKKITGTISSPETLRHQIDICAEIAKKCATIPADPIAFIKATAGFKTPIDALGIASELEGIGISQVSESQNGIASSKLVIKPAENENLQAILGKWNKTAIQNLVGSSGQVASFIKMKQQIRATTDNLSKMADTVKNNPELAEKLAKAMVSDIDYHARPYMQRRQGIFAKFTSQETKDKITDYNRQVEKSNDAAKTRAVGSKRMVVSMAMDFGKEVATFCKDLIRIIEAIEQNVLATCTRFNTFLAKIAESAERAQKKNTAPTNTQPAQAPTEQPVQTPNAAPATT